MSLGTAYVTIKENTKPLRRGLARAKSFVKRTMIVMAGYVKGFGKSLISLKALAIGAFAGWGLYKLQRTLLDAASTAEDYRVRLNRLLRSTEKGNLLFKKMADFASKVPFAYREIMGSATALAGVMEGGVEQIQKWMPMITDLAAVSGLTLEETTGQVIRMYSAGAGAADLFRERGILAMLGFKAGVKTTAEETRRRMFDAWEAVDSKFRGTTKDLAKTWKGLMSMFGDLWFQFRNMIMDAGLFEFLKDGAERLLSAINELKEKGKLQEWAQRISSFMIDAANNFIAFGRVVIEKGKDFIRFWMRWLGDFDLTIGELFEKTLAWLTDHLAKVWKVIISVGKEAMERLKELIKGLVPIVKRASLALETLLGGFSGLLGRGIESTSKMVVKTLLLVADTITKVLEKLAELKRNGTLRRWGVAIRNDIMLAVRTIMTLVRWAAKAISWLRKLAGAWTISGRRRSASPTFVEGVTIPPPGTRTRSASRLPSFQSGTGPQGLPRTGLFFGHKGEIVKNPADSEAERMDGPEKKVINITIAPKFMTGDRSVLPAMAVELKRVLTYQDLRWGNI